MEDASFRNLDLELRDLSTTIANLSRETLSPPSPPASFPRKEESSACQACSVEGSYSYPIHHHHHPDSVDTSYQTSATSRAVLTAVKSLQSKLGSLEQENRELNESVSHMHAEVAAATRNRKISRCSIFVQCLKADKRDKDTHLQHEIELRETRQSIMNIEQKLHLERRKGDDLASRLSTTVELKEKLKLAFKQSDEEKKRYEKLFVQAEGKIQQEIHRFDKERKLLSEELGNKRIEVARSEAMCSDLQRKLAREKEHVQDITQQRELLRKDATKARRGLIEQLDAKAQKLSEVSEHLSQRTRELITARAELEHHKRNSQESCERVELLQVMIENKERGHLATIRQMNEEKDKAIQRISEQKNLEITALKQELHHNSNELREEREKRVDGDLKQRELQRQLLESSKNASSLKLELGRAREQFNIIKEDLSLQLRAARDDLLRQHREHTENQKRVLNQLQMERAKNAGLEDYVGHVRKYHKCNRAHKKVCNVCGYVPKSVDSSLGVKPGSHMKVDIVKKHPVSKLHHSTISSKKKSRKARSKSTAKMLSRDLSFSQELPFTVGSSTSQSFSIPVNYQEVLAKQPTPGERGISSSVSDDHWCHCQDWSCIERGLKQVTGQVDSTRSEVERLSAMYTKLLMQTPSVENGRVSPSSQELDGTKQVLDEAAKDLEILERLQVTLTDRLQNLKELHSSTKCSYKYHISRHDPKARKHMKKRIKSMRLLGELKQVWN